MGEEVVICCELASEMHPSDFDAEADCARCGVRVGYPTTLEEKIRERHPGCELQITCLTCGASGMARQSDADWDAAREVLADAAPGTLVERLSNDILRGYFARRIPQ